MPYLLFSGHMIDKPDRSNPRFPMTKTGAAAAAIRTAVHDTVVATGPTEWIGIAAAACGGDILFHEVCRELGVRSNIYLGIPVDEFEKTSVAFAGSDWVKRYRKLVSLLPVQVLFPAAKADIGNEVWEKANEWMLKTASSASGDGMALIVLWDGEGGDGPGGTKHMVTTARKQGALVRIIDPHTLADS